VFAAYDRFEHANSAATIITECRELSKAKLVLDEKLYLRGAARTHGAPSWPTDLLAHTPMPQQSSLSAIELPVPKVKEADIRGDSHEVSKGRVFCTVTLSGWSTPDVDIRTTSHVVSRAVAVAVDEKLASVRVQVLKVEYEPGTTVAIAIDFEVVPISSAEFNRKVSDRVEAKLILLGMTDSEAKQAFDKALAFALVTAERHTQLHAKFGSVVQLL